MAEMQRPVDEAVSPADATAERDESRSRRVENALYRRACGYKVKLKKSFKVKNVEYDRDTGKKVSEREDLKEGFEEVHIPADVRVCAYYLNNRDPGRWREHPKEEDDVTMGMVAYPDMAVLEDPVGEGSVTGGDEG